MPEVNRTPRRSPWRSHVGHPPTHLIDRTMSSTTSLPLQTATPSTVLAVALGRREVGVAVLCGDVPQELRILNLRKVHSREAKEARFRQRVEAMVNAHTAAAVVAVR